jgi:hypothetical protein
VFLELGPNISLEPVVHGPTTDIKEAAKDSIQEVTKIMVAQF